MSSFPAFAGLLRVEVYADHYRTPEDSFGLLSSVHLMHPMRRMETIRVGTMAEMRGIQPLGLSLRHQNKTREEIIYLLNLGNKPEVDVYADNWSSRIGPIAATALIPEETFSTQGAEKAIIGLLWRKVDAVEAILWWSIFTANGYSLGLPSPTESFREIFALGRAFLMRTNPEMFFDALMTPRTYGAMLLDNAAGTNQDTAYTEHQIAAGPITPIPIAANYRSLFDGGSYADELIAIYPSSLPRACKRYIYEVQHVNKVRDATEDRNLVRVTCERYLAPVLPLDYYFEAAARPALPVAVLNANDAISAIGNKYGLGTLANLDYIASVL